jgi:hypothetical protein
MGRRATKGMAMSVPKVALLPDLISSPSTTQAMACANFTVTVSYIKKIAPWQKNCPVFQQFLAVVYSVAFEV